MSEVRITPLYSMLLRVRDRLREEGDRLVLAESCTAGLVAAELGQIPGISELFCGSMVVYRTPTKIAWLDIPVELLEESFIGPVSPEVTAALARSLLDRTPEATVSAAITGHLGPGAPPNRDGQVFFSLLRRDTDGAHNAIQSLSYQLTSPPVTGPQDLPGRRDRQKEASYAFLAFIETSLFKS